MHCCMIVFPNIPPPPKKKGYFQMAVILKPVSKQREGSSWSLQTALLNRTACNFNDYCLALSGCLPACHSSLPKSSAISQLLLKYESASETSWLIVCRWGFAEQDCGVWVLSRLTFHPCEEQKHISEDVFAPNVFIEQLNTFFALFVLLTWFSTYRNYLGQLWWD